MKLHKKKKENPSFLAVVFHILVVAIMAIIGIGVTYSMVDSLEIPKNADRFCPNYQTQRSGFGFTVKTEYYCNGKEFICFPETGCEWKRFYTEENTK